MGQPDNSTPPHPPGVPADARWDVKDGGFEWSSGACDSEGRRHGAFRRWTRAGVPYGEMNFEHGKRHGKTITYHPDGTVASEADWAFGVIMDSALFRSDGPSPEAFTAAAPNVWSVRYYTRDGKTNYTIRYFTRDGAECGPDGNPLPRRPAAVAATARWFPDMDRWVDGEIERGTSAQVGPWRWWSRDGVLRREELRDVHGEAITIAEYRPAGSLEKTITRGVEGEQRDHFYEDGSLSCRRRDDANGREIYQASWRNDGCPEEEIVRTYEHGELATVTERRDNGVLAFEARREADAMACLLYAADGKTVAASGNMRDGKLAGTWRLFGGGGRAIVDIHTLGIEHAVTGQGLQWCLGYALYRREEPSFPTPPELAGVDDEPWTKPRAEIPRLLRGTLSSDELVRGYALGEISRELEHDGATSPAAARVIPWLARTLSNAHADRELILTAIERAGLVHADDRASIEAVHAAWPLIFGVFKGASQPVRTRILALAKLSPDPTASLLEVAQREPDPAMRACAIDSMTRLDSFRLADVLPCLADRDLLVRVAAAIAIGCTKGPEAPRDVISALAEGIRNWRDIANRFAELPYIEGHVLAHLALATGSIRTPDARSLAQILCAAFDEVDGRSAITYGQGMLSLAFGRGERPFAKRFIEILDTIARSKKFWSSNDSAHAVLDKWHLPRERTALVALIAELHASNDPDGLVYARMREPAA
ncbi:MAG: putative thioredoxin [Myxococcales bacterium]|nr:putative thioredoxin [Myxococcales bacterium]